MASAKAPTEQRTNSVERAGAEDESKKPEIALVSAEKKADAQAEVVQEIARTLPVAEDIIVESDSGGHTDNQTVND